MLNSAIFMYFYNSTEKTSNTLLITTPDKPKKTCFQIKYVQTRKRQRNVSKNESPFWKIIIDFTWRKMASKGSNFHCHSMFTFLVYKLQGLNIFAFCVSVEHCVHGGERIRRCKITESQQTIIYSIAISGCLKCLF